MLFTKVQVTSGARFSAYFLCVVLFTWEAMMRHQEGRTRKLEIDRRLPESPIASQLMGAQRQGSQERRRDVS